MPLSTGAKAYSEHIAFKYVYKCLFVICFVFLRHSSDTIYQMGERQQNAAFEGKNLSGRKSQRW